MILIGLAGKPGSGRDRIAKHLVVAHNFAQYRMIGPVRSMLAGGLGIPLDLFEDPVKRHQQFAVSMPTPAVMEASAKEWGERINPELWIALAAAHLNMLCDWQLKPAGIVVSDLFGDREADWIRRHGGAIWHTGDIEMPVGDDVVRYVDDDPSILLGPNDDPGALIDSLLKDLYARDVVNTPTSADLTNVKE
jgi:hypothetical protein